MTTRDEVAEPESNESDTAADDAGAGPAAALDEGRTWYIAELLLALEVSGLAAFAFSRSILDTFGRSPDTFIARGADAATIVLFGLIVAFAPALVLALVGLVGRPLGATTRWRLHVALVAVVGGMAVWQIGQGITGYPPESEKMILAGAIGALLIGALRARRPSTRSYLRFVGVASVIFLVQFLFLAPTSAMVFGDGPALDDEHAADVAAMLGDDPPDVMFLVFDALPTMSLLDGTGHVDGDAFPNFARLAATSDWYRNHTSVSAYTGQSVPTILTGQFRERGESLSPDDDKNIFTLLGGSYEMHVREAVTRLCPDDLCVRDQPPGLGLLLGDAVTTWSGGQTEETDLDLPGALGEDRYDRAESWIDAQHLSGSEPELIFYHAVLPHGPWYLTDEGEPYEAAGDRLTGTYGMGWTESGIPVGHQRHLLQLQAADRLLGQLLDKVESAGTLDDTLVVVTADHGESFLPAELMRGLTEGNAEQVMWAPLFVKAPGQTAPRIDDSNVLAVDVVPTIADILGVDLPWDVDGMPASEASDRGLDTKVTQENENNGLHADEDDALLEIDDVDERFANVLAHDATEFDGPDSVWKRTAHGDLVGHGIDGLRVGDGADTVVEVERLDDITASGPDELLLEVVGDADLPKGAVVAYGLNGTIGAVTAVEQGIGDGLGLVHGLLPPRLFVDGTNELTAYLVEGEVGAEVLRPLTVRAAD